MKWIKRLWYRLWLWNAQTTLAERLPEYGTMPDKTWLESIDYWGARVAKWQSKLDALDAPDDDSEQLSNRAIPSYMFWPK